MKRPNFLRRNPVPRSITSMVVAGLGLAGCMAMPSAEASRLVAQESFQVCPANWPKGAQSITSAAQWQALLQQTGRSVGFAAWQPDFAKQTVWAYAMGQQRSGGYSVRLVDAQVSAGTAGSVLRLGLQEQSPAAGSLNTAQLTSPCVLALLDTQGTRAIEIALARP